MVIAPVYFALVLLVPLAAQWHLGRTLRALIMGLMIQAAVLWVLDPMPTGATLVLVMGVGQVVALMWLIQVLRQSTISTASHQGLDGHPRILTTSGRLRHRT